MIRPLRRRHFRIFLVLAATLVLLWLASLAARPPAERYLDPAPTAAVPEPGDG